MRETITRQQHGLCSQSLIEQVRLFLCGRFQSSLALFNGTHEMKTPVIHALHQGTLICLAHPLCS